MKFLTSLTLLVLTVWSVSSGVEDTTLVVPNGSLCPNCYDRVKSVLEKGWTLQDPLVTAYGVLVFNIFKLEIPKPQDVCKYLQSNLDSQDGSKLEAAFAITSAISKISNCKANPLKPALKQAIEKITKDGGSSQDIFYSTETQRNTGVNVDYAKVTELLKAAMAADDGPQSLGYAFWATANSFKNDKKLEIWDRIEDVLAQADEVDKQFLQYEGGLSVTAVVVNGIFRLADVASKPYPLTSAQVVKFGNYLVSRKTVTTPRGLWLFASSLEIVAKNKNLNPVYVGLSGANALNEGNKMLKVKASDLLGNSVDVNIVVEAMFDAKGSKVAGVQTLQAVPSPDKNSFTVDFKNANLPKGFYKAMLIPKSPKNDKKLILLPTPVEFKVIGKLGAVSARVGVSDLDQQSKFQWHDVNAKQKLKTKLDLEPSQKLVIKVATSQSLHQAFVNFRNKVTKKEVTFIAQPETDGKTDYKLEVDLNSNARDVGLESGEYEVTIILGDFLLEDSLEWNIGDVVFHVPSTKPKATNSLYSIVYGPKPEIEHQFRKPEPRPPRFLSDAFTAILVVPFLILLGLWAKVGANIRGFPFSLSALGFHIGLAGIFAVYILFWLRLTMFEALKLVWIPGAITFISGHKLLSYLSQQRSKL